MKTYSVHFIDARDGYPNHKLLEAPNEETVRDYMQSLGHEITKLEVREYKEA